MLRFMVCEWIMTESSHFPWHVCVWHLHRHCSTLERQSWAVRHPSCIYKSCNNNSEKQFAEWVHDSKVSTFTYPINTEGACVPGAKVKLEGSVRPSFKGLCFNCSFFKIFFCHLNNIYCFIYIIYNELSQEKKYHNTNIAPIRKTCV